MELVQAWGKITNNLFKSGKTPFNPESNLNFNLQ